MTALEELIAKGETEEETEDGEGEPEPAPQGEPEPGEPDEPPEEPLGFNPDRFEKENRRHERELRKVFGDSFSGMKACDTCGGVGFTPEDHEPPAPLPEVRADPTLIACEACNAWGQRKTPSLDERYLLEPCTVCSGKGYRDRDVVAATEAAQAYAAPPPPAPSATGPRWDQSRGTWVDEYGNPVWVAPPTSPPATYPAP